MLQLSKWLCIPCWVPGPRAERACRGSSAGEGTRGTHKKCYLGKKKVTREASRRGDASVSSITTEARGETVKESLSDTHVLFDVPAC